MRSSEVKEFKISTVCVMTVTRDTSRRFKSLNLYIASLFSQHVSILFSCSFCYGHISDQDLKPDDIPLRI